MPGPRKLLKLSAALVGTILIAGCAGGSDAPDTDPEGFESVELTFTSPHPEGSALNAGFQWWAEQMSTRTDGAVEVTFHYNGSLYSGFDTLGALSDGLVDAGFMGNSYWPSEFPLWNVATIPFVSTDPPAQAGSMAELYKSNQQFTQEWERNGVHPLMFITLSPSVTGLSEPIDGASGLAGKSVRMTGYGAVSLAELGMVPEPIDPSEVYESIQRGVIDGFGGWPFDAVPTSGLAEVAPHIYDIGMGFYSSGAFGISLATWHSLDPDLRTLMDEVAAEYNRTEAMRTLLEAEQSACEALQAVGATVTVFDQTQMDDVRAEVGTAAFDQWRADVAQWGVTESEASDFYDEWIATYDQLAAGSTYQNGIAECAGASE